MKKLIAMFMATVMLLAFAGCGSSEEEEASPSESVVESEESSSEDAESTEGTESAEGEESKEAEEASVDYTSGDVTDWMSVIETEDEMLSKLVEIDSVPYGSAGSSLKSASAGASMLQLAETEGSLDKVKEYLSSMSDIQKDYFSFAFDMSAMQAKNLLADVEGSKALLSDAGREDVDLTAFTEEKLTSFVDEVNKLLEENSVLRTWQDHKDIEPFNAYPA